MPEIIPIRDLRNTTRISDMCNETDEPIFITKNGYGDMVIMSMDTYERKLCQSDMFNKIQEGKHEYEENNVVDGKMFMEHLKKKYEL